MRAVLSCSVCCPALCAASALLCVLLCVLVLCAVLFLLRSAPPVWLGVLTVGRRYSEMQGPLYYNGTWSELCSEMLQIKVYHWDMFGLNKAPQYTSRG